MNRYDFKSQGQRFVLKLMAILLGSIVLYTALKFAIPPSENVPAREDYARMGTWGRLTVTDPMTLNWVVASEQADGLVARMGKRADDAETLAAKLVEKLRAIDEMAYVPSGKSNSIVGDGVHWTRGILNDTRFKMSGALTGGDVSEARKEWETFYSRYLESWPNGLRGINQLVDEVSNGLSQLDALLVAQSNDFKALSPPASASGKFWTTCWLSLFEVLFFSFFGVLANLLVNSAHFLSTGEFKPSERWVAYTKLCYGPILSLVLVLGIMFGWFDLGSYEVRVFTLPLLAFLLGYFSRRVVRLVDRLGSRVLGEAEKSIDEGPAKIAERRRQQAAVWLGYQSPRSLSDLRSAAKAAADEIVSTTVMAKEAKS